MIMSKTASRSALLLERIDALLEDSVFPEGMNEIINDYDVLDTSKPTPPVLAQLMKPVPDDLPSIDAFLAQRGEVFLTLLHDSGVEMEQFGPEEMKKYLRSRISSDVLGLSGLAKWRFGILRRELLIDVARFFGPHVLTQGTGPDLFRAAAFQQS